MRAPSTIPELLARRLADGPGTPVVTTIDHRDGDRVELSAAALANWVAKTGNLLDAELDVGPGDEVALVAEPTWLAWVVALACWSVGAMVHPVEPAAYADDPEAAAGAALVVVDEALAVRPAPGGARLVVLGAGMGGRAVGGLPDGALDFGAEVLAEPDELLAPPPSDEDVALRLGQRLWRQDELCARALGASEVLGSRLVVSAPLASMEGLVLGLLAPLAAGGHAVGIAGLDPSRWWATVAQERSGVALLSAEDLVRLPEPEGEEHDLTRFVVSGAAPGAGIAERLGVPVERLERGGHAPE